MNRQLKTANKEKTLLSLAMLKITIDEGADYLNYLKPFVINSLKDLDIINDRNVSQRIKDKFGLIIPSRTCHIVLKRLSKEKTLKKGKSHFYSC